MSLAAALAARPSLVQAAQQRQAALLAAAKEARATEEKARGFRADVRVDTMGICGDLLVGKPWENG